MAFPTPPLPILLVVNALLGGLFIYADCEAYQLSNPNLDVATAFAGLCRVSQVATAGSQTYGSTGQWFPVDNVQNLSHIFGT